MLRRLLIGQSKSRILEKGNECFEDNGDDIWNLMTELQYNRNKDANQYLILLMIKMLRFGFPFPFFAFERRCDEKINKGRIQQQYCKREGND